MKRRTFIKQASLASAMVSGFPLLNSCSSNPYSIEPGVATSMDNHDLVTRAGFSYIEEGVRRFLIPDQPEEEFKRNLDKLENAAIPIKACNSFISGKLKSTGPDAVHEKILSFAEIAFRRAKSSGVKHIVFGSGGSRRVPEDFPYNEATDQFINLCRQMGPIAAEYGIVVVIEPLNSKECNFITTVSEGASIVRTVEHPNIQLLADIYHMKMENEGPESIRENGDIILHTHVAEKEGRTPPGINNEDLSPYFEALKNSGYSGGMSIEARWSEFEEELRISHSRLNELIS